MSTHLGLKSKGIAVALAYLLHLLRSLRDPRANPAQVMRTD